MSSPNLIEVGQGEETMTNVGLESETFVGMLLEGDNIDVLAAFRLT